MMGTGQGVTLIRSFPVPKMKPASVLPMPVANCPKAPALQVCESVPNNTSPEGHIATCQLPVHVHFEQSNRLAQHVPLRQQLVRNP